MSGGSSCIPAKFYPDGQLAVSTRFGDFPALCADHEGRRPRQPVHRLDAAVLSQAGVASSTHGRLRHRRVTDENPRTFWVAAANTPGQTLTLDLGSADTVRAVQVNFADYKSGRFADAPDIYTEFTLQGSLDGRHWQQLARTEPPRRDRPNAYFELPQPVRARFIRYVHGHVGAANLAISDIRVFGNADGRRARDAGGGHAHRATRTSATRPSAGRRCRAQSATISASASGPTG